MFLQVVEGRFADGESLPRHLATWTSDVAPGAHGWLRYTAGVTADGTFLAITGFESEAAARTNRERPEHVAWWDEISQKLDGELTVTDCPGVDVFGAGGSDEADVVQVVQGPAYRSAIRRPVNEMREALDRIHRDIIARAVAWTSHGTFIQIRHVAIPLGAAGIVVAVGPELVRGTFSSTDSVLRVAAVVGGWFMFSRLMRRVVPNARVRTVVKAVAATLLLWLNVGPYFKDDVKIAGRFPESFTTASGSPGSSDPGMPAPGKVHPTTPTQPVQLTSGPFRGLAGHRGSGQASIFRQPDGSHVVAFRDLSVSSVPDPVLYLVPGPDQERLEGATRLGRFDPGRDRYEIPAGADLTAPLTVLIWCRRFAVPVAGATQSPV